MKKTGFTIIELVIVMAIIVALAGAIIPMFRANRLAAQQARVSADLDSIRTAALMFNQDTGMWPPGAVAPGLQTGAGFVTNTVPVTPGWNGAYLDAWRADPWTFNYRMITAGTVLSVGSYGADNAAGGADANLDNVMVIHP